MPSGLIIAGTHSGVGKTTVAVGVMAALRRRGLVVQPFKTGPDFIDPGHHEAVCGRPSRTLDTWMLPPDVVRDTLSRGSAGADVAVIEGVMGLFDGRSPDDPRGSTADLAKRLGMPVVLVVDATGSGTSVAAVVAGFAGFDPDLRLAGVICNRVAGERHYTRLRTAIRRHTSVPPLGWVPREPGWAIPSRHLGLVTAGDLARGTDVIERLGASFEQAVGVNALLGLAGRVPDGASPRPDGRRRCRVAVARDRAFCFYYPDTIEMLAAAGAEVLDFSPLEDERLPDGVDLVYLGGGYPELHARRLAENTSMTRALRRHHEAGKAVYAECGGLMYVCRELVDQQGTSHRMLDLLPARSVMQPRLAALGYVVWRADADSLLGPAGTEVRGHEYHYSRLEPLGELHPVAGLRRDGEAAKPDGYQLGGLLAGYAHLHFGSNPGALENLLSVVR